MVHKHIISSLKQKQREDPNKNGSSLFSLSDHDIARRLFINFRISGNSTKGLRLCAEGNIIMSSYFKSYKFEHNMHSIKPYQILFLDSALKTPWFANYKNIIFYDQEIAARYKLCGNLEKFVKLSKDLLKK